MGFASDTYRNYLQKTPQESQMPLLVRWLSGTIFPTQPFPHPAQNSWLSLPADQPMLLIRAQHLVEYGAPSTSNWDYKEDVNRNTDPQYRILVLL